MPSKMDDDVIFPNDWVDNIIAEISREEVVNEMLKHDMTTNGLSLVELVMKGVNTFFHTREEDMQYEKLMSEPKSISDIEAFSEVADLWRWKGVDQACFSNDQTPGQVYRILANDVTMYLFIEIDTENPNTHPQTTAMKLWQDVTFGRVNDERSKTSVGTIHLNMGTARKDQFEAYATNNIHRDLMYPGQIYSWIMNLARACVFTIGNFIAHNIGGGRRKKDQSTWSKVIASNTVYDLHFFIGDYQCRFPSQCHTGVVPYDKTIDSAQVRVQGLLGVQNNRQRTGLRWRNYAEQRQADIDIQKISYRPICTQPNKAHLPNVLPGGAIVHNPAGIAIDTNRCMQIDLYTDVHTGNTEKYGATVNFVFVQRVSWEDIEKAVVKIKNANEDHLRRLGRIPVGNVAQRNQLIVENNSKVRSLLTRTVRGAWYLQDMQHFMTFAKDEWGLNFQGIIAILLDIGGRNVDRLPDTWHKISENDSAKEILPADPLFTRRELDLFVYDEILEPFTAQMENLYHKIIYREEGQELRFPDDLDKHWIDMKLRLVELKEQHATKQLRIRTRENNSITQKLPDKFKSMNLRDCLLGAIKDESRMKLEPELVKYLEKYKSEYMVVFCRLVQCHSLIALHELARKYEVEYFKEEIERALDSFGLTVQSEIQYMLSDVAKNSSILFETNQLTISFVKPIQKPFWIRRFNGGYTFGRTGDHAYIDHVEIQLDGDFIQDLRQEVQAHLQRYENEKTLYWKFLTQQDFYKGLPRSDGAVIVGVPGEYKLIDIYRLRHNPAGVLLSRTLNTGLPKSITEDLKYNMQAMYGPDNKSIHVTFAAYMDDIQKLFSLQLYSDDGNLMPLLFYTRIFFVCRHIALAGLIPGRTPNHYPQRMWEESHSRNRGNRSAGEEYSYGYRRINVISDGVLHPVEVTDNMARALMYTECFRLLFHAQNVDGSTLDRMSGRLLELVLAEMEEIGENYAVNANSSYDFDPAMIAAIPNKNEIERVGMRGRITDAMRIDTNGMGPSPFMQKLLFYRGGRIDLNFPDSAIIDCGRSNHGQANLNTIGENLHKLLLLMKMRCNSVMAEIENQIKLPLIMSLARTFSLQAEDVNHQDTSIENAIFQNDENTSPSLKRVIQFAGPSSEALANSEDLFGHRDVWFREKYEHYFLSSFVSLRDLGLFRHEPFRARLFQYTSRGPRDPKYTTPSSITVRVASERANGVQRRLMVRIENNREGILRVFAEKMIVDAYMLTVDDGVVGKSAEIPIFLDTLNVIEEPIISQLRAAVWGDPREPSNVFPASLRAQIEWMGATPQPDDSALQGLDDPGQGNLRIIQCRTWSDLLAVHTRAHSTWNFSPVLNHPHIRRSARVYLYHGTATEHTIDRSTSQLWRELYQHCGLPHNALVTQNVKDAFDDFVKIERARIKMYENLSSNTLPGNLAAYWSARDDTAPVCFKHGQGVLFIECDTCSRNRKLELERVNQRPDDPASILSQKQWQAQFTKAYRWKYLAISCMHSIISKNVLWKTLALHRYQDYQRMVPNNELIEDLEHFENPAR